MGLLRQHTEEGPPSTRPLVLLGKAVVVTSVVGAELRSIGVQRDHVRLEDSGNG